MLDQLLDVNVSENEAEKHLGISPELAAEVNSTNLYNTDNLDRVSLKVKDTLGENWKEKLVNASESEDSISSYSAWKILKDEVDSKDILLLTRLLANPKVCECPDRSVRSGLTDKLNGYSDTVSADEKRQVINYLKRAETGVTSLIEKLVEKGDRVVNFDRTDLFNIEKTIMIINPAEVSEIIENLAKNTAVCDENFSTQMKELATAITRGNIEEAKKKSYRFFPEATGNRRGITDFQEMFPEYQESHDPDYFSDESEPYDYDYDSDTDIHPDDEKEDIAKPEFTPLNETEIVELAVELFKEDMKYMSKKYDEKKDSINILENGLPFRALIFRNPVNRMAAPILMMRPDLQFDRNREYDNDDDEGMFHRDIWKGYKIEAKRNPRSERAKLCDTLLQAGGYETAEHLYLALTKKENNQPCLSIYSG